MRLGKHIEISPQALECVCHGEVSCLVRGVSGHSDGCGCRRVCHVGGGCGKCACFVGAGPVVVAGNRAGISAGSDQPAGDPGGGQPPRRRSLGDGGSVALHLPCNGCGRGVGRPTGIGFHRDQTFGAAGRTVQGAMLAGPAWGHGEPQRSAQSLACGIHPLASPSARPQCPRRSALEGGTVPVPPPAARHVAGNL